MQLPFIIIRNASKMAFFRTNDFFSIVEFIVKLGYDHSIGEEVATWALSALPKEKFLLHDVQIYID